MTFVYMALALLVSAIGGYFFTALVLKLAQRRSDKEQASDPDGSKIADESEAPSDDSRSVSTDSGSDETPPKRGGPDEKAAKDALRGGMWIGILERVLITGFMLTGNTAGVAVVVAIKGLGRYPELNASTSERFIIGTLASLAWAALCAFVAGRLINGWYW